MDEASKNSLCEQFTSFTGVDKDRATFFLESSNWNFELAIQSFYENSEDLNNQDFSTLREHSDPEMSDNEMDTPNVVAREPPLPNKDSNNNTSRLGSTGSNIATLSSLRNESDPGGQAFYAGGSEHSGQQVLGPRGQKRDTDRIVSDMFKQAKENAEVVTQGEDKTPKSRAFGGQGFTLGTNSSDSKPVMGPSTSRQRKSSESESEDNEQETILKLWQNGFSVDDGPLRSYDDPQNVQFLNAIRRGEIPPELSQNRSRHVCLAMEDHRQEEYKPPTKKPAKPFTGEGHRLGTPASEIISQISDALPNDPASKEKALNDANSFLTLDSSQPNTRIQIRLADGSRLVAQINLNKTVSDLRQYICIARPEYAALQFNLMTTFPNKVIDNESATIKDSGLANSSIVQRLA